jgi:hypothetical protein
MVTARNRIELGRITGCPPSARSIATSPNGMARQSDDRYDQHHAGGDA